MARKLKIKIPVLISSELLNPVDNYRDMTNEVQRLLTNYNAAPVEERCVVMYRGKLKYKVIPYVQFDVMPIDGRNHLSVLLRIEEYKQGNADLYLRANGQQNNQDIQSEDALGSNCNYAFMYPLIKQNDDGTYTNRWVTFIYDDPSKDDADLKNTVKTVITRILNISVIDLYMDHIQGANNANGHFDSIKINYVTKTNHGDDNVELNAYKVAVKETETREIQYEQVPVEEAQQLINNFAMDGYQKKVITVDVGDGVKFKYTYVADELGNVSLDDLVESNCYTIEMTEEEIEHMHEPGEVIRNMRLVINQFLNT